jgi:hypothetical protein
MEVSMGLPASQHRRLTEIESVLEHTEPRLAALFMIFGRLHREEAMPAVEQLRARAIMAASRLPLLRRLILSPRAARLRAALVFPFAAAALAGAVLVGAILPGQSGCRAAPRTAHPATSCATAYSPGFGK